MATISLLGPSTTMRDTDPPDPVPPVFRGFRLWWPCLDPLGTILVAPEPAECPDCRTARAFFWIGRDNGRLRYRCIGCLGS